jgi:hypothetical protein
MSSLYLLASSIRIFFACLVRASSSNGPGHVVSATSSTTAFYWLICNRATTKWIDLRLLCEECGFSSGKASTFATVGASIRDPLRRLRSAARLGKWSSLLT